MNADRLLEIYEQISEAPDAIVRLRRFVLELAVRGKLIEQDASEEPVNLSAEKRHSSPLMPVPSGWAASTIGQVLDFQYGKGKKKSERSEQGPIPVFGSNGVVGFSDEHLTEQDAIIVGRKGSAGALNLCVGPSWTTDVAYFVEAPGEFQIRYLLLVLQALNLDTLGKGVKPGLSRADAYPLGIHIPPLAEQRRIVAKVDELMALCDRLEEARKTREETRDKLTAASLARLTARDTTPEDFPAHAAFALEALPAITTRPDQIMTLRQTILNLAVRGKLVEQDPADESIKSAKRLIQERRNLLIETNTIRKEKLLPAVDTDDAPFAIPDSWEWVRVGQLALFTQYGTSEKAAPVATGVPVLTMGNIQDGVIIRKNEKRLPESSAELPSLYLKNLDLLYNRTNSAELVGKTGLYQGDDDCLTFASYLIRIRLCSDATSPAYVNLAMNAPDFRTTQIVPFIKKQTGQANVSGSALKNMLIPLPPLAEQHRIVAKVDALMALGDQLEAALTTTDTTRTRLLEALLHEALEPGTEVLEAAE